MVGGHFFTNARTRVITSPACLPSRAIRSRHARALSRLGGPPASQRRMASAFAVTAASGCRTSCTIEAVSSPIVATRLTCASCAYASSNPSRMSSLVRSTTRCSSSSLNRWISALVASARRSRQPPNSRVALRGQTGGYGPHPGFRERHTPQAGTCTARPGADYRSLRSDHLHSHKSVPSPSLLIRSYRR